MLFITGLLTLLVLSCPARGDTKGGVKGHPLASASKPVQQSTQEEATPYNVAIKSAASNVKTLSPSDPEIQAVAKGGSPIAQGSQQVQGKAHHASTLHHTAVEDIPASDSSAARGIKTGSSSSPVAVKGSGATKSVVVAQQEGPVLYAPKGLEERIKELNRGLIRKQDEEGFLKEFGAVDGVSFTADDLEDLSKRFGVGGAQVRPDVVVRTSPERAPGSAAPVRSGSPSGRTPGGDARFTLGTSPGSGRPGSPSGRTPGGAGVRRPPAVPASREPIAVPVRSSEAEIVAINRGLLQKQGEAGLAQTFGGIVRADGNLAGVSVTDAELQDLTKQIGLFGSRAPVAARPEAPKPVAVRTSPQQVPRGQARPESPKPSVVRTSPQQVPRGQVRPGSSTPLARVPSPVLRTPSPGAPVRPSSQGDRIIAINQQLLQKQGEAGLDQTFRGIVRADGNLAGVSVTDAELQDLTKQIGLIGSRAPAAPKPARPSAVRTSPQQVPGSRGQFQVVPGVSRIFGTTYTGTQRENTRFRYGSNIGIRRPAVPGPVLRQPVAVPGPVLRQPVAVPVQTFRAPAPVNPAPQGEGIIAINRQLIQKQGETGLAQTFGGIVGTDGNLAGVSITDLELQDLTRQIGFGSRSPAVPKPEAPKPARPSVVTTSPQLIPGYRRPVQVIPGLSGISGITGTTFTSTGVAGIARPYYPAPALRVPGPAPVPVIRAGVPAPLSPVPAVRVPYTAPVRPAQLGDDIISINRELIQKQGDAGFVQRFEGIVGTGGIITESELQDLTRQIGFGSRAPEAPKPVAPKPARPSVVRTSPQYVPESGRPAVSGISRVQGTTFTTSQRQNTIFTDAVLRKPISPASPSRPRAPVPAAGLRAPSPAPVFSPAAGSPDDIIAINRQLIQKQETSGVSQAFGGIADGNLAGLSLTTSDVENLSKQIGFGSRPQAVPQQPKPAVSRTSPQQVPGSRPSAPGSRTPSPVSPRAPSPAGPRAPSTGFRTPSPGSPSLRTPSPGSPGLRAPSPGSTSLRTPSGSPSSRTPSPGSASLRTPSPGSPGLRAPSPGSPSLRAPSPGSPSLRAPSPGAPRTPSAVAPRTPSLGSGAGVPSPEAIVAINRGLIQKQGEGGLSEIFGGAIRTDADLSGLSLTASQLEDLSRQFGTSGRPQAVPEPRRPEPSRPQTAPEPRRPEPSRQAAGYGLGRQPARGRGPQGSTRGGEGLPKRVSQDRVIQESFEDQPSDENDSQLQVKLDDIKDPSIQSQVSLGDFSETAYVPPFNYRVPSSRPVDGPQEQQKLEQVFV